MGQKTSPIGFRTGITRGWESTWFASKQEYGTFLVEDQKIRKFIDAKYNKQMPKGGVARTEIVRTRNEVTVTLHSARPGVVIGPRGGEVDKLREDLEMLTGRKVAVNVVEIKEPDLNAFLVAEAIAEELCKRAAFRRSMKQHCEASMNAGAKGVKIMCSGRLAGAEIARREMQKLGSIPLHTLDADVDYSTARAETTYGTIGIKVWIYKGKFGEVLEARQQRRRRPFRREDVSGGEVSGERRGYQRQGRGGGTARATAPEAASEQPQAAPPQQENPQGG